MADPEIGQRLQALRERGAGRGNPVRFAYLEALARRAAQQPAAVRQPLIARIVREAEALAERQPAAASPDTGSPPPASPLADLLAYLGEHTLDASSFPSSGTPRARWLSQPKGGAAPATELKSVAYFRQTWSKLSTEQQLTQTLAQAPENAGPMNSQHLVLRALQAMRDLSPDYLQGFMSYVDTLIWLEQANPLKAAAARSGAGEEAKKSSGKRSTAKR